MNDGSDIALLQVLLDFLELPTRVFVPLLDERAKQKTQPSSELSKPPPNIPDPVPNTDGGSPQQIAAQKRAYEDLWAKAMQALLSNGAAPSNEDTLQQMEEMHPKRASPLNKHSSASKVSVSTHKAQRFLYAAASNDRTCVDVFGWAMDYMFQVRETPFLRQVARLTAHIASANVPDCFGTVLTCGSLLALHKEDHARQAERHAQGLQPKLRPINIGSQLLKGAFRCALHSKSGKDATSDIATINMGLGAERGVERMGHLFSALWNKKFAILGVDFANGFNALLRQSMLDAVHRRCPEFTPLFNLFYARDSLCFFVIDEEVRVILSQEGSRMGCVLGSFGFDLTVQDIYESVQAHTPSSIVRAATDDMNVGIPPQDTVQDQLRLCGELFEKTRDEARRVAGLEVNIAKCKVLLPLGPDDQPLDLRDLVLPQGFPTDLPISVQGIKVAGTPVGTDLFVREFVMDALDTYQERILALPGMNPQVGFGLLRMCVSSAPIFLAQVTPPLITSDLFVDFDSKMVDCGLQLLTLPGHDEPAHSAERRERARTRMQLPISHQGAGISSITLRHPLAYFASIACSAACDKLLADHIEGLQRFAADTHQRVLQVMGPPSTHTEPIEDMLCRANPLVLMDPPHFVDILMHREDKRLQRALTHAAHAIKAASLHRDLASRTGDCATFDLIAACSRDNSQRILTARLSDPYNRLTPHEFICWARRFLQLPPLMRLSNAAPREGFDYDMEQCLGNHAEDKDSWLDLYGSHDNGHCAPTSQGKHKGHTLLKWVVNRFARKVPGVRCVVEPKTSEVLLGQYSAAQCTKLFPKRPSREQSAETKNIVDQLDEVQRMPHGEDRRRLYRELTTRMDALNQSNSKEKKSVRLDVQLQHGQDELLLDGTIVHSLAKSYVRAEAKRTWERLLSPVKSVRDKPAAVLDQARLRKFQTYNPLLYVIKKQVVDGRRNVTPVFTPMAVTTLGELGPGCAVVQEWLAMRFKAHLCSLGHRPDGLSVPYLVGKFRADFRLALLMVVVRRAGAMQLASGLPNGSIRGVVG